jgi:alpha-tubulin suppressor-like RCC1 family protein
MEYKKESAVACGEYHTVAITREGKVVCWGSYKVDDDFLPIDDTPPDLGNGVSVAAGTNFSMALTREGKVVCWGPRDGYYVGQCDVPVDLENVIAISGYCFHAAAVTGVGYVGWWGWHGARASDETPGC